MYGGQLSFQYSFICTQTGGDCWGREVSRQLARRVRLRPVSTGHRQRPQKYLIKPISADVRSSGGARKSRLTIWVVVLPGMKAPLQVKHVIRIRRHQIRAGLDCLGIVSKVAKGLRSILTRNDDQSPLVPGQVWSRPTRLPEPLSMTARRLSHCQSATVRRHRSACVLQCPACGEKSGSYTRITRVARYDCLSA